MAENIPDMEWLYHIDLDLSQHRDGKQVAATAKLAYELVKKNQPLQEGDKLIIAVVRPRA